MVTSAVTTAAPRSSITAPRTEPVSDCAYAAGATHNASRRKMVPKPHIILFAGAAKEEAWFFMNETAGASMEREHPRNRFIATPRKEVFNTGWEFTSQLKRFGLPGSAPIMEPWRPQII